MCPAPSRLFVSNAKGDSDEYLWLRTIALSYALFILKFFAYLIYLFVSPFKSVQFQLTQYIWRQHFGASQGLFSKLTLASLPFLSSGCPTQPLLIASSVKRSHDHAVGYQDDILGMQLCPHINPATKVSLWTIIYTTGYAPGPQASPVQSLCKPTAPPAGRTFYFMQF